MRLLAWRDGRQQEERMWTMGVESVIFQMIAAKKRKTADENHVFQVRRPGNTSFVLKTSLFVLFAIEKSLSQKELNT